MEKGGEGVCCNTVTYSTGEEALAVDGERTNNYAIKKFILEITCTLLNKRVNLYRGVFLYSLLRE